MKRTITFLTLTLLFLASSAVAADPTPQTATTATTATVAQTATGTAEAMIDRNEVRRQLYDVLNNYPPEVGRVLKLDPTLYSNKDYMANYPVLAEFVSRHPEVAHNPGYYLDNISVGSDENSPRNAVFRAWMQVLGAIGGFAVFLVITSVLIWMIKTLIQQRRWSRLSRIQTEVHSKLLDRFTSNEELLAYIQTPAGRRFLESAPIQLDAAPAPMSAPLGRISTSLQAGLVTAAGGVGLYFASMRFAPGAAEPLAAVAVVAIFIGIAFVLSAGAFYGIYRRFGVWETPTLNPGAGGE